VGGVASAISLAPICSLVAMGLEWKDESLQEIADSMVRRLSRGGHS
jgi:hypothetical protein